MSELDMCTDMWKDMCTRIISVMNQKTKQGPSVRVSERCKRVIEELAESMEISQTEVIQKAVEALRRELYFRQMKEDFEAIAADGKMASMVAEENALFDSATSDGIE